MRQRVVSRKNQVIKIRKGKIFDFQSAIFGMQDIHHNIRKSHQILFLNDTKYAIVT